MADEQLSPDEMQLLEEALKGYGSPQPDEKHNVHTFLNNVSKSIDTTKTGNLTEVEIGFTPYSLRTYKKLELDSEKLCTDDIWKEYFHANGEILTATSLSKDAKLITLAVLQKKEIADVTKPKMENKGWFKRKEPPPGET